MYQVYKKISKHDIKIHGKVETKNTFKSITETEYCIYYLFRNLNNIEGNCTWQLDQITINTGPIGPIQDLIIIGFTVYSFPNAKGRSGEKIPCTLLRLYPNTQQGYNDVGATNLKNKSKDIIKTYLNPNPTIH